jgi:hypothetical protein
LWLRPPDERLPGNPGRYSPRVHSPVQHGAYIPPGREGLFNLVRSLPDELTHEVDLAMSEGDMVMVRGRYTGHG